MARLGAQANGKKTKHMVVINPFRTYGGDSVAGHNGRMRHMGIAATQHLNHRGAQAIHCPVNNAQCEIHYSQSGPPVPTKRPDPTPLFTAIAAGFTRNCADTPANKVVPQGMLRHSAQVGAGAKRQ